MARSPKGAPMSGWWLDERAHAATSTSTPPMSRATTARRLRPGRGRGRPAPPRPRPRVERARPRRGDRCVRPRRRTPVRSSGGGGRPWPWSGTAGPVAGLGLTNARSRPASCPTSTRATRSTSCSPATRSTSSPTSGRRSPSTGSPACSPRRRAAPEGPRLRLRAGRGGRPHRGLAGRRRGRPRAGLHRRRPQAHVRRSSAPGRGCWTPCSTGPASTSSSAATGGAPTAPTPACGGTGRGHDSSGCTPEADGVNDRLSIGECAWRARRCGRARRSDRDRRPFGARGGPLGGRRHGHHAAHARTPGSATRWEPVPALGSGCWTTVRSRRPP